MARLKPQGPPPKDDTLDVAIACADCDVKRVVYVCGSAPEEVVHETSAGTLLVHVCDPEDPASGARVLAKSPALGGLYPFTVRDAGFGELTLLIDRAVRPANLAFGSDECRVRAME